MTTNQVGQHLPALTLPRLGGGELSLASLHGKKRLVFFWGSW